MRIITIWAMLNNDSGLYEHNHISIGFTNDRNPPMPTSKEQNRHWSKACWRKTKGILNDIKVEIHDDNICEYIKN